MYGGSKRNEQEGRGKKGEAAGMVDYAQLHYILAQKWPYATWCNTNKAPWNIQSSDKPWYPQRLCLEDT